MKTSIFSCDSALDIAFIPFMPASTEDKVEVRVQIRTHQKGARLDAVIAVDGIEIDRVDGKQIETYYFFTNSQYYSAGEHILSIKFKESSEERYEQSSLSFTIEEERLPILSGGFVMLGPPNDRKACAAFTPKTKQMTAAQWESYIDEMAKINIRCIIVNVTVQFRTMFGQNTAHYPSKLYPRSDIRSNDPIRAILRAAERNSQHVFIGLGHTYGGNLPNTTDIMDELFALYSDSPAFYGWYESEEVNIRKNNAVLEQWKKLRAHASLLSPVKPIMISPYSCGLEYDEKTGGVHPDFLKNLADGKMAFDIIAPQDMVGHTIDGGRLSTRQSGEMFKHLAAACKASGKHLWANCEAFDFDEDGVLVPRFNGGGMDGENGYIQQIEAARPYCEKIVTFMLNGFFLPKNFEPNIGGEKAEKHYDEYKAYMSKYKK